MTESVKETNNPAIVGQLWPDLDRVIQFVGNERGVWAGCNICGMGLRGWPSIGPTAGNARLHLDENHPGWETIGDPTGAPDEQQ